MVRKDGTDQMIVDELIEMIHESEVYTSAVTAGSTLVDPEDRIPVCKGCNGGEFEHVDGAECTVEALEKWIEIHRESLEEIEWR